MAFSRGVSTGAAGAAATAGVADACAFLAAAAAFEITAVTRELSIRPWHNMDARAQATEDMQVLPVLLMLRSERMLTLQFDGGAACSSLPFSSGTLLLGCLLLLLIWRPTAVRWLLMVCILLLMRLLLLVRSCSCRLSLLLLQRLGLLNIIDEVDYSRQQLSLLASSADNRTFRQSFSFTEVRYF